MHLLLKFNLVWGMPCGYVLTDQWCVRIIGEEMVVNDDRW